MAGWWPGLELGDRLCHRFFYREPDSTYFDLPPSNHTGDNEVSDHTEVTMDVFQMRNMNDSVMVSALRQPKWELHRTQAGFPPGGLGALACHWFINRTQTRQGQRHCRLCRV